AAVLEGAVERVRPKLMTVATTLIGLLPIMWSTGTGAEAMKRIAAPMVGGLISSTILTLVLIPVIYEIIHERKSGTGTD
ncbi:MAG: Cu(I)/Ag(I) efflux system membrane protein CusA/SilA, partial [Candidatus Binatia bacterium]